MRRSAILGLVMIVPALLVMGTTPGCKKGDQGGKKGGGEVVSGKKGGGGEAESKGGTSSSGTKAVGEKHDGSLKGQVTFDGEPPAAPFIAAMKEHKDKEHCLAGKDYEKEDQKWIVNKSSKGVANVVVWLEPPAGGYFALRDEDKKAKDAELFQPHCAFIPHVLALYPAYYDGKKRVPTGQKLIVHNDADMPHNTKVRGSETANPQRSETIPAKDKRTFEVKYQKQPLDIGCDFHPWMNAKAWTFDNPYHAVTDLGGNYKIDNVPTDVEVTVVFWHEVPGKFKTEKTTFKSGSNTLDAKVKQ